MGAGPRDPGRPANSAHSPIIDRRIRAVQQNSCLYKLLALVLALTLEVALALALALARSPTLLITKVDTLQQLRMPLTQCDQLVLWRVLRTGGERGERWGRHGGGAGGGVWRGSLEGGRGLEGCPHWESSSSGLGCVVASPAPLPSSHCLPHQSLLG